MSGAKHMCLNLHLLGIFHERHFTWYMKLIFLVIFDTNAKPKYRLDEHLHSWIMMMPNHFSPPNVYIIIDDFVEQHTDCMCQSLSHDSISVSISCCMSRYWLLHSFLIYNTLYHGANIKSISKSQHLVKLFDSRDDCQHLMLVLITTHKQICRKVHISPKWSLIDDDGIKIEFVNILVNSAKIKRIWSSYSIPYWPLSEINEVSSKLHWPLQDFMNPFFSLFQLCLTSQIRNIELEMIEH